MGQGLQADNFSSSVFATDATQLRHPRIPYSNVSSSTFHAKGAPSGVSDQRLLRDYRCTVVHGCVVTYTKCSPKCDIWDGHTCRAGLKDVRQLHAKISPLEFSYVYVYAALAASGAIPIA